MSKKKRRRRKKKPTSNIIDGRAILIKHSHRAARATQVHQDQTKYNRTHEKRAQKEE